MEGAVPLLKNIIAVVDAIIILGLKGADDETNDGAFSRSRARKHAKEVIDKIGITMGRPNVLDVLRGTLFTVPVAGGARADRRRNLFLALLHTDPKKHLKELLGDGGLCDLLLPWMCSTDTAQQRLAAQATGVMVKGFADGADRDNMRESYANPLVSGFTTNPTRMRRATPEFRSSSFRPIRPA